MRLVPIAALCPVCGSQDVIYSCAPHCCFNHVCGTCRASWQHGTALVRRGARSDADPGEYDTSFAAAPCAGCGGLVFQIDGSEELFCPSCTSVLRLECTDVQPFA